MSQAPRWICCQIGGREHYAVPRGLHASGCLEELITDAWSEPSSLTRAIGVRRLRERFHPGLADAPVWAPNLSSLGFEASLRLGGVEGWDAMLRRNEWFQHRAAERLAQRGAGRPGERVVLFAYSYAARHLFEFAKSRGWTTVLGQIDPGPVEERLVTTLHHDHREMAESWRPAPPQYWQHWRDEWQLADRIVVNSEWSRSALISEGVPAPRIEVIPLAYERGAPIAERRYPDAFSEERPLELLFLGQVNLRKGIAEMCDALRLLADVPVRVTVAGPLQVRLPEDMRDHPRVQWVGSVPHGDTAAFYQAADVFLFPTHSDGFGLTQLEAMSYGLPVIASQCCGEVVRDGINGVRLPDVSGRSIAEAIRALVARPSALQAMSTHAADTRGFKLADLSARLQMQMRPQ